MIKTANGNEDKWDAYAQAEEQYARFINEMTLHLTEASKAHKDIADSLTGLVEDIKAIDFSLN